MLKQTCGGAPRRSPLARCSRGTDPGAWNQTTTPIAWGRWSRATHSRQAFSTQTFPTNLPERSFALPFRTCLPGAAPFTTRECPSVCNISSIGG